PRNCGLFFVCVWHDLATGGSAKHRLSMALKLVLWFGDAMIDADTMLRSFVCSWY
ncbi:hypothetical protein ACV01_003069, partial [Salmonella enterica subsp. enterica]|nr:hypothetical protein [Salmonella enterica subsp. enterica serovar Ealing]